MNEMNKHNCYKTDGCIAKGLITTWFLSVCRWVPFQLHQQRSGRELSEQSCGTNSSRSCCRTMPQVMIEVVKKYFRLVVNRGQTMACNGLIWVNDEWYWLVIIKNG